MNRTKDQSRGRRAGALLGQLILVTFGCLSVAPTLASPAPEPSASQRPNFLLLVADDIGFSDLGFMGSEIRTPNIDALAARGTVLSQYYVSPACSPTRAMLLTGLNAHAAGLGTMRGEASPEQRDQPGYRGILDQQVPTIAELLREAGYHTYMAGKWHLGDQPGTLPRDRGFDHAYGILAGGATHFDDQLALFSRGEPQPATFLDDDEKVTTFAGDWFSSTAYTNALIQRISENRDSGRPFFAYAAFTAPHWPLQAPDDFIDRYAGTYDSGWDFLRRQREAAVSEVRELGIPLLQTERLAWVPAWETLSPEEQRREARVMEIYAAMIEHLDHEIGRLLTSLEQQGVLENTIVVFFSDNGAEGNPVNRILDDTEWVERNFDNRLENIGREGSYVFTSPGWAQASSAPLGLFKTFPAEGGIRTPAVFAGPGIPSDVWNDHFSTVRDIAPSVLQWASAEIPQTADKADPGKQMTGQSLVPLLQKGAAAGPAPAMVWETFGRRAVRDGDWKALWLFEPYGAGRWQLFNLREDPAELQDLAEQEPQRLKQLLLLWDAYADTHQVILPAQDSGYALEPDWRLSQ